MPMLKGFECTVRGYDGSDFVVAATASKARAQYWRRLSDVCDELKIMDISVRRAPSHDVTFPDPSPEVEALNERERHIILHTFGGGSHLRPDQWGNRNHYCCAPNEPILNELVERGLMTGPHGVEEDGGTGMWCGAFFYLSDNGKEAARALIGQREAR